MFTHLAALAWLAHAPALAAAEAGLVGRFADRAPMFANAAGPRGTARRGPPAAGGSLFGGATSEGLFAGPLRSDTVGRGSPGDAIFARLRDLIAQAEAGMAGYDAVQSGARRPPPKPPTRLSLREIFDWIDATPGQHHAIGRYQIIPATLRRLITRVGLDPETRFSPTVQDRLADLLLTDAGLHAVQRGDITRATFRLNLAKVWAGLPTDSGRSYYHDVSGNRAVLSHDRYSHEVDAILDG